MRHPLPRPSRPVLADAALWAGLTAVTGYGFLETDSASLVPDLLLPSAVLAVAAALSRRRPGAAVLLAGGLCALGLADPVTPAGPQVLSLAVLSFLLGARVAAARGPLLVLAACLAAAVAVCAVLRVQPVWWFYALTVLPAALLPPWLAGRHWRGRRELVREGWRLAVGLEERQHLVAERARLTERTDIAADMHDSLGHVLSLVALRAGALELSPDLTERDRADLAELRGTVADAVEQLRETVAVLHEPRASPGGDGTSVPETVEELLGRAVASGVPVRWERRGPVPALSPLVERGIHRVVREALTNAVKHAPGAPVRVEIVHEADRTRVGVVNAAPPPGAAAGAGPDGGRRGLTGLRERVSVLGGSLRTEPYRGGFRVGAVLPHRPPGRRAPAALPDPGAAPESARRLAEARRTARRRSALALVAPLAAAAFFVPAAGCLARQLTTGVLPPHRYDRLEPGRTRAELAPLLPARPFPYPPDHVRAAPAPAGARCEAYRSGPDLLHQVDFYRLCWSGGVLVSRDTIRADPR